MPQKSTSELESIWNENRASILSLLQQAHKGVKGTVKDQVGRSISGAIMKVSLTFLKNYLIFD